MRDRLGAVGGHLEVHSVVGEGTTLEGVIAVEKRTSNGRFTVDHHQPAHQLGG
jgi:hypothetical protein